MLAKDTLESSPISRCFNQLILNCLFFLSALRYKLRNILFSSARASFGAALIISFSVLIYPQDWNSFENKTTLHKNYDAADHLDEQVPKQYLERYNRWKAMLLSVESGRQLWSKYADDPTFRLTIIVSKSENQGAKVDDYVWDEEKLVGVTITLGSQLDYGFPSMVNYPVLGSLAFIKEEWSTRGSDILAAAKFAHELGHVEHAASSNAKIYKLQNELSPIYAERFLLNGHNQTDPILKDLEARMGGVPAQIKVERENWAETYALRYLRDKLKIKKLPELLKRVRKSIEAKFNLYSPPLQAVWSNLTSSDKKIVDAIR